jgi:tripartite-type tricarboxylate transporter receptor subunit TctC
LIFGAFIKGFGLEMASIFYRDLAPAIQDIGEGRLDIYVHALSVLIPQAQSGRVRILAVASQQRSSAMPDVPSVTEVGFPELSMEGLCGFFGSRAMTVAIRERVAADVMAIANEPNVQERLGAIGQAARPRTTAEFTAFLADNRKRLMVIAKTAGIPTMHR